MNQQTVDCALARVPATVESAFVLQMNGMFQENSVTVMTETATSTMDSPVQGMESVTVATVTAGMDGMEMHAKSGLARNILDSCMGKESGI